MDEENLEKLFLKQKEVLSDPRVFETDAHIGKIVHTRDTSKFFQEVATYIKYKIPNNIIVVGDSGTGKTVTAKYLFEFLGKLKSQNKISGNFFPVYINCSNMTTSDVLTTIYSEELPHLSGHSSIVKLLNDLPDHTLIFLDEVDRAKDINELLYKLSRPKEINPQFKYSISFVLISNNIEWESSLDTAIRSSLNLKRIDFNRYSSHQIYKILEQRVDIGFKEKIISNSVLKYLSDKIYEKYNSDCRIAILTLLQLGQNAETKGLQEITEREVDAVLPKILDEIHIRTISKLQSNEFFTLFATYKFANENSLQKIYEDYTQLMEKYNISPIKRSKFYKNIEYLESHSLIARKAGVSLDPHAVKNQQVDLKIRSELLEIEFKKRIYNSPEQTNGQANF